MASRSLSRTFAISPRHAPELCHQISAPLQTEGAGNAGLPMRPIAACAMGSEMRTRVSQVTPESPGIPHAMVLRFPSRSPGRPAFLPPSPAKNCFSPTLRQHGASGPHDFSVRQPHRPSSEALASTASRSAFRDVAQRPPKGAGRRDRELICHFGKPEFFCKRGLTQGVENRAGDLPDGLKRLKLTMKARSLLRGAKRGSNPSSLHYGLLRFARNDGCVINPGSWRNRQPRASRRGSRSAASGGFRAPSDRRH